MSDDRPFSRIWKGLRGQREAPPAALPATSPSTRPARGGIERRRLPRVRVLSALHGYEVELDVTVTMRDVSLGGFAVESPISFTPETEHTFLFATADGRETMVRCVCRHARALQAPSANICVAGFQFLPHQEESLKIIVEVYERLRARPAP